MKTRYKIPIIFVIAISGFIVWSLVDTVCKPCIIPPNALENYFFKHVTKSANPAWFTLLKENNYFNNP